MKLRFVSTPEISPSWIKGKIDNIQESLGFTGGSMDIRLKVNSRIIRYTENGREEINDVFEMPINLGGSTYSLGADLLKEEEITKTVEEEVEVYPSNVEMIPPALLFLIPLIGLVYVTYQHTEIDESDLVRMKKEYWWDEFEDWISKGKMPDSVSEVSLEMESLEDLVDAAVDMDNRVIYDEEKSTFFFFHGNVLYLYDESVLEE